MDRFEKAPREVPFDSPNDSIRGGERSLVRALPEHRIVYLKFRTRLVWHKPLRRDRIFGSHGSGEVRRRPFHRRGWRVPPALCLYCCTTPALCLYCCTTPLAN